MKIKNNSLLKNQGGLAHPLLMVFLCAVITGVAGYAYLRVSKAATTTTNVNVATYNVRSQRWDGLNASYGPWSQRLPRVKAIISKEQPGILGMQEVIKRNPDTNKTVSQRTDIINFMTPMGYGYMVGSDDNSSPLFWKNDNFTQLNSSEYLIFDSKSVTASKPSDKRASRYLTFVRLKQKHHNKNIVVLNYHFNQFEQADMQLSKLASVIGGLKKQYPADTIFFTGDFNQKHNDIIARLKTSGVTLKVSDGYSGIDHVLVSNPVTTRSWANSGLGSPAASDHPMITSRLAF